MPTDSASVWRRETPPASVLTALDNVRRKHPSYLITYTPPAEPDRRPRYVATAIARDVHPVVVISADLAELSASLDPRDAGAPSGDPLIIPLPGGGV